MHKNKIWFIILEFKSPSKAFPSNILLHGFSSQKSTVGWTIAACSKAVSNPTMND